MDSDLKGAIHAVAKMPHDCEFLTAPMGDKHCHYDKQVVTIRIRDEGGYRQISYDDWRTSKIAKPSDVRAVRVTWRRVEE